MSHWEGECCQAADETPAGGANDDREKPEGVMAGLIICIEDWPGSRDSNDAVEYAAPSTCLIPMALSANPVLGVAVLGLRRVSSGCPSASQLLLMPWDTLSMSKSTKAE